MVLLPASEKSRGSFLLKSAGAKMEKEAKSQSRGLPERQQSVQDGPKKINSATFEEALSACGYGKFNYLVLLSLIPMTAAQLWCTGSTSFVVPSAECDLQLTEIQKGLLNAAVYAGNIIAGMIWGVVADKFGRKNLIVGAFVVEFVSGFALGFVNSFWVFLFLKFITGLVISAPNAIVYTYMAETHTNENRAQAIMYVGLGFGVAGVLQPLLAYFVLPLDIPEFSSWRVFLLISSIPAFLSVLAGLAFPESPKFLFSRGRNEEGLQVLKKIFSLNTGEKPGAYPILSVSSEIWKGNKPEKQTSENKGWMDQFKTVLVPPYITRLLLIVIIQFLLMLCVNSIRLWTPQLFAFLDQYDMMPPEKKAENITTVCDMISLTLSEKPALSVDVKCQLVSGDVYLRSMVIGAVSMCFYIFGGTIIRRLGPRILMLTFFPVAAVLCVALNWADSADMLTGILSLLTPFTAMAINALTVTQVDFFPTHIRALAVSVVIMFGRIASLSGNLILPVVLSLSCPIVFIYLAGCLAVCFLLAWMLPRARESS